MDLPKTVVMQLELILKYFKPFFKDFKVFHRAWVASSNYFYGLPGGLSENGNKANLSLSLS